MTSVTEGPLRLDQSFFTDPHALYTVLRQQRPVVSAVTTTGLRVWLVTRYADARAALNDPRLGKDSRRFGQVLDRQLTEPGQRLQFADAINAHMLSADPPDHTRLRKLVNRAFTVRTIGGLRPRIEAIAAELADAMVTGARAGRSVVDLLDAFAFPLPMTVICEVLGVYDTDAEAFRGWSNTLLSDAPLEQRGAAAFAMQQYLSELVVSRRDRPGDDMLSAIVQATEDADRLSEREAVSMAFLLLIAGHETTVNLIGNGMLALLRNRARMVELRSDPALTRQAVEELLRFDGPLNTATFRHTTEPVTISGVEIPADEVVLVALSSANRDSAQYERPEQLDLHRGDGHLAFGYGIHHCLGAPLARMEGEIAFRTLLDRFPGMELAVDPDELSYRSSTLIRGLNHLPVRLGDIAGH
jgi:cytochrome P450